MFYSKVSSDKYLIRLLRGEEINEEIKKFCQKLDIKNASFIGIGSIENLTLAHYRVDTKKYKEKNFKGIFKLTSLIGTVGIFEDEPLVHVHVTLSDEEMKAFGGHLVKGIVSATVEIVLTSYNSKHTKSYDKDIGLKLWDLPEKL
jgi:predicted DNA-binding protein with PD1-like motif